MKVYEIRIKEQLDRRWQKHFEGFELSYSETQNTLMRGAVQDQSRLQAILEKLFNLNLTLLELRLLPLRDREQENFVPALETN